MAKRRYCIISLTNKYLTPYIYKYIDIINQIGGEYDIVYWNRHGVNELETAHREYVFNYVMPDNSSKKKKLIGYIRFSKFASKILKKYDYDRIIATPTSTAIFLCLALIKKYKKKFIIDIRDYTAEKNRLFYRIEKRVIANSGLAVISSEGYKEFLPHGKYICVHNKIKNDNFQYYKKSGKNLKAETIQFSFIGLIRFQEQNKKIILKFANDNRFQLNFIGMNAFELTEFCETNNIKNVKLIDRFEPSDTLNYYQNTDLINNLYGNNSLLLKYALSNKLYYAAELGIPIVVCPDTYMGKYVLEYGLGFIFDINSSTACDDLYQYYNTLDRDHFRNSCKKFLETVEKEEEIFYQSVYNFLL